MLNHVQYISVFSYYLLKMVNGISCRVSRKVGLLLFLDIHAHLGFIFWHLIKLSTYLVRSLFSQMFPTLKKAGRLLFMSHNYGHTVSSCYYGSLFLHYCESKVMKWSLLNELTFTTCPLIQHTRSHTLSTVCTIFTILDGL